MSRFWNLFIVCVILVGSLTNPLSNTRISNKVLNLKNDISYCVSGGVIKDVTNGDLLMIDKNLYLRYNPLDIDCTIPVIHWERES